MPTPIDKMCNEFIENVTAESNKAKILLELADAAVEWENIPSAESRIRLYAATKAWEDIVG